MGGQQQPPQAESGAAEPAALTEQAQTALNQVVDGAQELANHALDAGVDAAGAIIDGALKANRAIADLLEQVAGSILKKSP